MPFIIIFNIVVLVLVILDLLVILYTSFFAPGVKEGVEISEKKAKEMELFGRVRFYAYIVFFAVLIIMIIVNLIF